MTTHENLLLPFVAVLVLHIVIKPMKRVYIKFTENQKPKEMKLEEKADEQLDCLSELCARIT